MQSSESMSLWAHMPGGVADTVSCMHTQLTFTYSTGLQRNDQSLFHYGFVQLHDLPKMAAHDFPDGNFYDPPDFSDEDYSEWPILVHEAAWLQEGPALPRMIHALINHGAAGRGGALVSRSELVRLESILQQFPTTADEDARLLAGAGALYFLLCPAVMRLDFAYFAPMPIICRLLHCPVHETFCDYVCDRWCSGVA